MDDPYYTDEEVIAFKYQRPDCPVISRIAKINRKRLQNWQLAVALRLAPCRSCNPFYLELQEPAAKTKIGFV